MMKKYYLMLFALIAVACGNKTNSEASDADSTEVHEVSDTLNTVEAVENQVDAVYDYWNELREHYDENKPSVDERFGSVLREGCRHHQGRPHTLADAGGRWSVACRQHLLRER